MKTSQPRYTTCPGSLPVERTAAKALFTLLLAAALPLLCSGCLVTVSYTQLTLPTKA